MTPIRLLKWITGTLLVMVVLAMLFIAIFGWNWLRAPLERMTLERTGRELEMAGDLRLSLAWPRLRIQSGVVSFANPAWASEKKMLAADAVEILIDLPPLLRRNIVLHEVRLEQPVLYLEQGSGGRRNWLLDRDQQDESARIRIDRLMLDKGTLGYSDALQKTSISARLSTSPIRDGQPGGAELAFTVQGQYKGLPLEAHGTGGAVLAMRDEVTPYPMKVEARIGRTSVKADGTVTSLLQITAVDMRLSLRGGSLEHLFPLLGIAFPVTRDYVTEGQVVHSGQTWRYEKFFGRIGASDIAGTFELDTSTMRPTIKADLASRVLDLDDLGPLIGARPGSVLAARKSALAPLQADKTTQATPARARVLPDMPFKTDRWSSVNAEVTLKAGSIRHPKNLPLENLSGHLSLRDAVLRIDSLDFGVAGGHLTATISMDGRQDPIQAHARVSAKKMLLARLLPDTGAGKSGAGRMNRGQINGEFDLAGQGNSVRSMLAHSSGKLGLAVVGGEISKLMLEKAGLHLWEILELKLTGDRPVKLHCAVADFGIMSGRMHANALIIDTEVTTIIGTGDIDLAEERLDLTLNPDTKNTSPLALRSPIYVRGSFARPGFAIDPGRVALRTLGAISLGMINPALALLPLIDAGPGRDSDCAKLVREATAAARPGTVKAAPRPKD